jgi:nitrogen regulatory protein PII
MKRVMAIIKPFKVDDVKTALQAAGVQGATLTQVHGHARHRGHTEHYRGAEYRAEFSPAAQLELLVEDHEVDGVVSAIVTSARTGELGDGKVVVQTIEDVIRIRTGEAGPAAL